MNLTLLKAGVPWTELEQMGELEVLSMYWTEVEIARRTQEQERQAMQQAQSR